MALTLLKSKVSTLFGEAIGKASRPIVIQWLTARSKIIVLEAQSNEEDIFSDCLIDYLQ
jgi:hypothetical protein